jgi:hypothetical protein
MPSGQNGCVLVTTTNGYAQDLAIRDGTIELYGLTEDAALDLPYLGLN